MMMATYGRYEYKNPSANNVHPRAIRIGVLRVSWEFIQARLSHRHVKERPGKKEDEQNATETRRNSHEHSQGPSVPDIDSEEQHMSLGRHLSYSPTQLNGNINEKLRNEIRINRETQSSGLWFDQDGGRIKKKRA